MIEWNYLIIYSEIFYILEHTDDYIKDVKVCSYFKAFRFILQFMLFPILLLT